MGIFRKKHDITDIYGVRGRRTENLRLPDSPTKRSYSRNYHNYFRGYTEIRRTNEKGRVVIERYYTKPWIVSGLSTRNYWLVRLLYAVLTAMSVGLFFAALYQNIPANRHWVVALPGLPTVTILFLQVIFCVLYIVVARKMTLWDHASSTKRLKVITLISAITQGLTALALVGYAIVMGQEISRTLICALMVLVAAICSAVIHLVERKMPYTEIPNNTKLPAGEAHEIR